MNREHVNYGQALIERKYGRRHDSRTYDECLEIVDQRFPDGEIDRWINEGGALCPRTETG